MSIQIQTNNGNRIITIVRTVPIAKGDAFLADFILALRDGGYSIYPRDVNGQPVDPATLNTQTRLNMLETFMVQAPVNLARNYRIDSEVNAARNTSSSNANENLDL